MQFIAVGEILSVLDYENDRLEINLAIGLAMYDGTMARTHLGATRSILSILRQLWMSLRVGIDMISAKSGIQLYPYRM